MLGRLTLSFDIIDGEGEVLNYTFIHCDHEWQPTELQRIQYASGFESDRLDDYAFSRNTLIEYVNYELKFPNEDMMPLVSGNYLLIVYGDDLNDLYFTRRFMVVDEKAHVGATIPRYPDDLSLTDTHQQLDIRVNLNNYLTGNTQQFSYLTIRQNGRWDNAVINPKPQYTLPNGLKWDHCRELIFDAGNEYRKFEVLATDHPTLGIDRMRWDGRLFHAFVFADEPRPNYLYDEDANGAFYIRNSDNIENDRLTDYVMVHFQLMCPQPVTGSVYLNGVWTYDRFLSDYEMEYDYGTNSYQATVMLKMGYYSYQYLVLDDDGFTHVMPTEGSYFQTENQYQALVYYREPGGRTDLLLGYQQVTFK